MTCSYLEPFIENPAVLQTRVNEAARWIFKYQPSLGFDGLAFTGLSGALFGFPLAYATGLPPLYVRKSDDTSTHSCSSVEGASRLVNKYLIIDDLVSSGKTIEAIRRRLRAHANGRLQCAGVLLYTDGGQLLGEIEGVSVWAYGEWSGQL